MDILNSLLLWIHLVALAAGGVATFGIPVVGSKMATATPETRPLLFSIVMGMSKIGRAGLGLLIVTGPLLFWLKWNFTSLDMVWFGIKMVLVLVLLGLVIFAGINANRAQAGDRAAAMRQPQIGMASMAVFLLIVLSAVFAFG
jgi:hypothetical protein